MSTARYRADWKSASPRPGMPGRARCLALRLGTLGSSHRGRRREHPLARIGAPSRPAVLICLACNTPQSGLRVDVNASDVHAVSDSLPSVGPVNRPVASLFQHSIGRALRAHDKLPLRSELHQRYSALYVDADQLQLLDTADWQVVYGRRGTGKTLLFSMFVERTRPDAVGNRQLSVLIPTQDCMVSPVGRDVSDKTRALGYFQTFLERLVADLVARLDELLGEPKFLDVLSGQRRRVVDRAVELQVALLDLANTGLPVGAYTDLARSKSRASRSARREAGDFKADARLGSDPLVRLSAEVGRHVSASEELSEQETSESGAVPRFALVRKVLLELLQLLKIDRLTILIDEWSMLDPTGATGIQPEFANLLKRTFHGTRHVTIKMATNRYQTRLSNRGAAGSYRGLQTEADIFTAANLDRAVLERGDLVAFYESLLFKRLVLFDESLGYFDAAGTGQPDETFVLSIFHNRRAFEELVKGSEGIPRDFLVLFNQLARIHKHSVNPRWTAQTVQDVIRQRSVSGQDDIEYRSVTSQVIDPCIRSVAAMTQSRIFFIRREHVSQLEDAVDELLEKRLIHDYPREELPGFAREGSRAYLVDYGLWLDWERTRGIQASGDVEESALPADRSVFADWHIDPDPIEREDRVRCQHCGSVFTVEQAAYARKGLCPECFEPVGIDPPTTA